jgi:rod shape-determining protein MreC
MESGGYKKYIFGGALLFLIIVHLIAYNIKGKPDLNFLEKGILTVAYPVQSLLTSITEKISGVWSSYIGLVNVKKTNSILTEENKGLKTEIGKMAEVKAENERLRKLLKFSEENPGNYVAAKVIATGPSNFYHTLVINKGADDGLKRGMAVLSADGVVGQISYVKGRYSTVITLLDPGSAIDAFDQVTRARGVLRGFRSEKLIFKYLPFSEKIEIGDKVVSSGMDGIYPKGVAVGTVERVENKKESLFQNVTVKPSADFRKLEEVLVNLKIFENIVEVK